MALRRASTVEEYAEWVENAVYEMNDLYECLLFAAAEDMVGRFPAYLEPCEKGIEQLCQDMRDSNCRSGREDPPCMDNTHRYRNEIPFHTLLNQINEPHRKGLEIDEDEL